MPYALCRGVSYCRIGERLLFLDLASDRYLCLPPAIEACFIALSKGENADGAIMAYLRETRLIERANSPDLGACPALAPPTSSLLDAALPETRAILPAITRLALASASLKWRGFLAAVAGLAIRKDSKRGASPLANSSDGDSLVALRVAAAFDACDKLVGSRDKCLPRSLAAAHRMLDLGLPAHLVVGVRLNPFHAHAWVQWNDLLVNERIDATRAFTPILVV